MAGCGGSIGFTVGEIVFLGMHFTSKGDLMFMINMHFEASLDKLYQHSKF